MSAGSNGFFFVLRKSIFSLEKELLLESSPADRLQMMVGGQVRPAQIKNRVNAQAEVLAGQTEPPLMLSLLAFIHLFSTWKWTTRRGTEKEKSR